MLRMESLWFYFIRHEVSIEQDHGAYILFTPFMDLGGSANGRGEDIKSMARISDGVVQVIEQTTLGSILDDPAAKPYILEFPNSNMTTPSHTVHM